ncbi:uncharacterized protein BDR25DRAFT_350278 [Lindgomyces ingoldianus]|uniref:Uncharacterized protein n=1 Tax=Lindgomyces ingoldianus TaxID=673940 RepID=A0ACB6RCE0_9PLEO|nr:uncharacterized protein BDR25DRAFT_350278 [Lindgomyces ingoldianus]KAF2476000.1 hypothetical protein BDR25DRAFT_350278 [Lindgomyces ingoldianus]
MVYIWVEVSEKIFKSVVKRVDLVLPRTIAAPCIEAISRKTHDCLAASKRWHIPLDFHLFYLHGKLNNILTSQLKFVPSFIVFMRYLIIPISEKLRLRLPRQFQLLWLRLELQANFIEDTGFASPTTTLSLGFWKYSSAVTSSPLEKIETEIWDSSVVVTRRCTPLVVLARSMSRDVSIFTKGFGSLTLLCKMRLNKQITRVSDESGLLNQILQKVFYCFYSMNLGVDAKEKRIAKHGNLHTVHFRKKHLRMSTHKGWKESDVRESDARESEALLCRLDFPVLYSTNTTVRDLEALTVSPTAADVAPLKAKILFDFIQTRKMLQAIRPAHSILTLGRCISLTSRLTSARGNGFKYYLQDSPVCRPSFEQRPRLDIPVHIQAVDTGHFLARFGENQ